MCSLTAVGTVNKDEHIKNVAPNRGSVITSPYQKINVQKVKYVKFEYTSLQEE